MYKEEVKNEMMLEFLGSPDTPSLEQTGRTPLGASDPSNTDEADQIAEINSKFKIWSNSPFKIESKTATLNGAASWSNREGEWFLAEKRLLFSSKRPHDKQDWLMCLKYIFKQT